MCCKNRPLAIFGACLAIAGGTASVLTTSDSQEPAAQVAPQSDDRIPELEHRIGEAEKRLDAPGPMHGQSGKTPAAKPGR